MMNFAMNHAPGAGSIAGPVDYSPAYYHCDTDAPRRWRLNHEYGDKNHVLAQGCLMPYAEAVL